MRKIIYLILTIFLIFYAFKVSAEESENEDYTLTEEGFKIPAGMELKKVGDANILIPKGGKIRKAGDQLIMESADEYAAREFFKIKERLGNIEKEQEDIRREIEELKKNINN